VGPVPFGMQPPAQLNVCLAGLGFDHLQVASPKFVQFSLQPQPAPSSAFLRQLLAAQMCLPAYPAPVDRACHHCYVIMTVAALPLGSGLSMSVIVQQNSCSPPWFALPIEAD